MPGLFRAQCRLRSRLAADPRRGRRRPLHRQRPEGLDRPTPTRPTGSSAWSAPTSTAKKHGGISFLLFDMASPGVSTKPILLISGYSPFCETFFDNVKVPKSQRVGTVNKGWDVAKYLLGHEREMISGIGGRGGEPPAEPGRSGVGRRRRSGQARRSAAARPDRVVRGRRSAFALRCRTLHRRIEGRAGASGAALA